MSNFFKFRDTGDAGDASDATPITLTKEYDAFTRTSFIALEIPGQTMEFLSCHQIGTPSTPPTPELGQPVKPIENKPPPPSFPLPSASILQNPENEEHNQKLD